MAWTYATHDEFQGSEMQANPIVVDGVVVTGDRVLFTYRDARWALDTKTGNPILSFG